MLCDVTKVSDRQNDIGAKMKGQIYLTRNVISNIFDGVSYVAQ